MPETDEQFQEPLANNAMEMLQNRMNIMLARYGTVRVLDALEKSLMRVNPEVYVGARTALILSECATIVHEAKDKIQLVVNRRV